MNDETIQDRKLNLYYWVNVCDDPYKELNDVIQIRQRDIDECKKTRDELHELYPEIKGWSNND